MPRKRIPGRDTCPNCKASSGLFSWKQVAPGKVEKRFIKCFARGCGYTEKEKVKENG